MRRFLPYLLLLLSAGSAYAQNTTVSAVVTDPDAFTWNNGSIQFNLVNNQGGIVTSNGVPLTAAQLSPKFNMDNSGSFTGSISDNTLLKPVGTQWDVSVCPQASAPCQQLQRITVSGATQNLTSTIGNQLRALRFPATYTARAYGAVEIFPIPPNGATYYDLNQGFPFFWNGANWVPFGGQGGGIGGTTTANKGVGAANAANTLATVPETGYETVGGVTTYTCNEDHNKGIWDVRCHGWATNPSTALTNTIQLAMCNYFTTASTITPTVEIPAGSYSLGGNITAPPLLSIKGVAGPEFGQLTILTNNDATKTMITQVDTETFTCNGTPFTATISLPNTGSSVGNIWFKGLGTTAPTDTGITVNGQDTYIHNVSFTGFGGPGRTITNGLNGNGANIFGFSNLQWYYFSGLYNPTSFVDSNPHGQLELSDVDGQWTRVVVYGNLQDTGYFNRYFLTNVLLGGGNSFTNSFIQIGPHNIWLSNSQGFILTNNRFDDGWWDSVHLPSLNAPVNIANNNFQGYCTSPTLNPANFGSNPGGVTTDANCASIEAFNLGSTIHDNNITEEFGIWPAWPVFDVFTGENNFGGVPNRINQPGNSIGGFIGAGAFGNNGADVAVSMYNITDIIADNVGTTLKLTSPNPVLEFVHYTLRDTATTPTYTTYSGGFPDTYITIAVESTFDSITPSATIVTCGNAVITTGVHWFWNRGNQLIQICN